MENSNNTLSTGDFIRQQFDKEWLNADDLVSYYGYKNRNSLWNRVLAGRAPTLIKKGRERLIHINDFIKWVLENETTKKKIKKSKKKSMNGNILLGL